MHRSMVILAAAGGLLVMGWPLKADGVVLAGLAAGAVVGMVVLLLMSAAGAGLGRLLQQTRLEDQVLSLNAESEANLPAMDWFNPVEQAGLRLSERLSGGQPRREEESRRFVWEDELPPLEILAEVKP